jgi:glutamate-ammonia-ligase adenylyltransferase
MEHLPLLAENSRLPRPARADRLANGYEDWDECLGAIEEPELASQLRAFTAGAAGRALLDAVFGNSPFLANALVREPALVADLAQRGPDEAWVDLLTVTSATLSTENDGQTLAAGLRRAKRQAALLIALADLAQVWDLERVTGALSEFADRTVDLALGHLLRQAHRGGELALPHPGDPGRDSGVIVIGMGKLGARELNYSSDIDLIVLYDEEKLAFRGSGSVGTFMVRLARNLVKLLEERRAEGYVFRTDLRLRPDPGSTPLAIALAAAETYYEAFGQNWERAAMIKARAVAGDRAAGEGFLKTLRPFVWRRNLDFAAIQDIHSIKRQINAHRGGATIAVEGHNIKLGRGGIREIEFFAQTQQLIWGGRLPALRLSGTCAALDALAAVGQVAPEAAQDLKDSYRFLRTLEHRLQMIEDAQTQTLPAQPERLNELAVFMGYDAPDDFRATLLGHLGRVEAHYARLFEDAPGLGSADGSLIFTGIENDPETLATLARMGFANAEAICSTIRGWHHGRIRATRSTRARELLTELTPALLAALARTDNPDAAFVKLDDFLARLPAGVQLFSLFANNPSLLDLLVEIMGNAPRLAERLARNTALLDSVLSQSFFAPPPPASQWAEELDGLLAHETGFEESLDRLRRWANDQKFRVGVLTLKGRLDAEASACAFTALADIALTRLLPLVEAEHARAHGRFAGAELAVLALGKMGGVEMTATSDLDLILVYETPPEAEQSDGGRPLAPSTYYGRLTQRLVNALTALTAEGCLYEVDMRLRPSGRAGPLAVSLESFARYHVEAAWTWEYQALTRARVITPPGLLRAKVEAAIRTALGRARDPDTLLRDVADMRKRMAKEHPGRSFWDIKHRPGGLVDLEFIAQYLMLREAHADPAVLAANTGAALANLARAGRLDGGAARDLLAAFRLWSAVQAMLRLTVDVNFREDTAAQGLKATLARGAGAVDFEALKHQMEEAALRAREWYEILIDAPAARLLKPGDAP